MFDLMKKFLLFTVLAVILVSFTSAKIEKERPVNLIIFIGDGMGVDQVYASMTRSGFKMTFPAFPVTGFSITGSANRYITDSAAASTAMATGVKTNNGMIAASVEGEELPTVMEMARTKGMSAGVIATSQITHATPAGFVAHEGARSDYFDIAKDFLKGTADVFIGGGKNHFVNRRDSADLTVELKKMGYDVVFNMEDLRKSSSVKIAGLMADIAMPSIAGGRDTNFLAQATLKAIEVLSSNPKGFILMVEGSQIDWAGHDNSLEGIINETLDMDRAVKVAYEFAKKTANTLIVVTADHETGGMTITGGNIEKREVTASFSTKGHTAVMVPVFAFGPGAGAFAGVQQNTELFDDFVNLLYLKKK